MNETLRKWPQFTLRSILIQTALIAAVFGLVDGMWKFSITGWPWMAVSTVTFVLTGASVGGLFRHFKIGAAIGFVHGVVVHLMLIGFRMEL